MPHAGELEVVGRRWGPDAAGNKAIRRLVQVVFQDPYSSLSPRMTVEEIVGEGLLVHEPGLAMAGRRERVMQALAEVGLSEDAVPRPAAALSARVFGRPAPAAGDRAGADRRAPAAGPGRADQRAGRDHPEAGAEAAAAAAAREGAELPADHPRRGRDPRHGARRGGHEGRRHPRGRARWPRCSTRPSRTTPACWWRRRPESRPWHGPPPTPIPESEVEITAVRAQGAGGQNVNKVSSAIHLRFDIRNSSLAPDHKERLLALADQRITRDGVLVIKAQSHRSQDMNRAEAWGGCRSWWTAWPRRPGRAGRPGRRWGRKSGGWRPRTCARRSRSCEAGSPNSARRACLSGVEAAAELARPRRTSTDRCKSRLYAVQYLLHDQTGGYSPPVFFAGRSKP